MRRPVLHDKKFAMSSDWQQHAENLEEYATYLEGGLAALKELVAAQDAKPATTGGLDEIMESFFGPGWKPGQGFGK